MALARSTLLSALSGIVGGSEVAMTKNGMVVKNRKPSRSMLSPNEQRAKLAFLQSARAWTALTHEQVQQFNAYANTHPVTNRLGESKCISGRAWFMKLRVPASEDYDPFTETTPPSITTLPVHTVIMNIFKGGPYWLVPFRDADGATNLVRTLWIARFQSRTTSHKPQRWIPINTRLWAGAPISIYDDLIAANVELVEGENIAFKYVCRGADMWPSIPTVYWTTVQPQLRLWYKCEDDRATSAVWDMTLQDNATFIDPTGNPNTNAHTVPGHINKALYFDGVDDTVSIPAEAHYPTMAANQPFTLAIWWKADNPNPAFSKHFLSNFHENDVGIAFATIGGFYRTSLMARIGGLSTNLIKEWPTPVDTEWHHFAMTRSGTTIVFYMDGVPDTPHTYELYSCRLSKDDYILTIGSRYNFDKWAPGTAEDCRLYSRALNPVEIAALAAM